MLGHRVAADRALAPLPRADVARASPSCGKLRVEGPVAEASLLAGWLRSRLERDVELEHEDADELTGVDVDGAACPVPKERPTSSDLLSAELDEFSRDRVYEAAARGRYFLTL